MLAICTSSSPIISWSFLVISLIDLTKTWNYKNIKPFLKNCIEVCVIYDVVTSQSKKSWVVNYEMERWLLTFFLECSGHAYVNNYYEKGGKNLNFSSQYFH